MIKKFKISNLKTFGVLSITGLLLFSSCGKDDTANELKETEKQASIQSKDGVLIFNNSDELNKTLSLLNTKNDKEIKKWEDNLKFKSQLTIYHEINQNEILNENTILSSYKNDITKQELDELGVIYTPSKMYMEYLNKGVIKEIIEDDENKRFELSLENKIMSKVVNEDGKVIINDTLLEYTGNKCHVSSLSQKFEPYTINIKAKGGYNWSRYTTATSPSLTINNGYAMVSSNKRFKFEIIGYSSHSTSIMNCTYYVFATGQEKNIWGTWRTTNTYRPVYNISGNWDYKYIITYPNGPFITKTNDLSGINTSPYSYYLGGSNYFLAYLNPSGQHFINSP